ncbi:hypothetical protein MIR68_005758 [Amoeboaphelidium protococcarum]|nr:hypothetical protein MIR68_005758 [Amoeboaphelidium protococcarum]KAI3646569.1 hypothetical protein MP228_009497 [Amoeboaphelidium protococcarum]
MMQFQLQAQGFGAAYRNVQLDEAAKSARTSSAVLPPANGFRFADNPKSFKFLYEEYYGIGLFQHCKGVQQMEQDGALYRRGDENLRKAFSKRRPAYALFDNFTLAGDRTETLLATLDLLRGEQSMFKWLDRVQEPQNELWRHPLFQPMRAKVLEQLQAKATVSTSTKKQAKTVLQNAASVDSGVAQGASNGTGVSLLNLASADGNADGTIRIPNINSYTQFCADMGNGRKDLHELWRAMSAEEKQVYKDRAAEVRRPYEELKARELEQKKVAESNIRKSRRK